MTQIGNYSISETIKKLDYKVVYLAQAHQKFYFAHEFSDHGVCDREYSITGYLANQQVD